MEWCLLIVVDCVNEVVKLSEAAKPGKQHEMEFFLKEWNEVDARQQQRWR